MEMREAAENMREMLSITCETATGDVSVAVQLNQCQHHTLLMSTKRQQHLGCVCSRINTTEPNSAGCIK